MENNVGKLILCGLVCIVCMTMQIQAYIDLIIKASDGSALHQAGVGRPFLIAVTIAGPSGSEPRIEGIEQFKLTSKATRIATTNGRTTTTYSYQVYCDAPGDYTIGPASVDEEGLSKKSNSRVVHVAEQQKTDKPAQQEAATLRLVVDKSRVVVGEKIRCTLQFHGDSERVRLEQIQTPHVDAIVDAQEGPITHTEQRNGNDWTVAEWVIELRSNKAGRLIIPACSADIAVQREVNDQLSAFSLFFKYRNERHKIYSNAVTIDVDELPVTQGAVQAVGTFKRFEATLKPAVAKEGEGMVLTLELEGDAQMNAVQSPQLQNMPDALKWYESKQSVNEAPSGRSQRIASFEYVVQGLQQGKWEIPAQRFTYFDIKDRTVKTIKSSPLVAFIKQGTLDKETTDSAVQAVQLPPVAEAAEELSPIITTGAWQSRTGAVLPWALFLIIVIIPLLWVIWQGVQLYAVHSAPYFMYRFAFRYARKQLKQAQRANLSEQLLGIFSQAIALRLQVPVSLVSQELIIQKLHAAGMGAEKIRAWDSFFSVLHERAFGKEQPMHSAQTLFEQARMWLSELEAVL